MSKKSDDISLALGEIKDEMGISSDFVKERVKKAICAICRNAYGVEEPFVEFEDSVGLVVKIPKLVSEEPKNESEIALIDAIKINPNAKLGDSVLAQIDTKRFGRISAQTARSVIRQGIRDGEKEIIIERLKCYENEIVSAQIVKIKDDGSMILKIGDSETVLSRIESHYVYDKVEGDFIKVYVKSIDTKGDSPIPKVSRSSAELVRKLFEIEVPEISQKIISIEAIARIPGVRTKVAAKSNDPNVDGVGACIGDRGTRIKSIVEEISGTSGNEKIDVIKYYEDPMEFIEASISPARVIDINVVPTDDRFQNECTVTVPDDQLSLAIGIGGQNVKLASRLTGWKLNLRPESGFYGEE